MPLDVRLDYEAPQTDLGYIAGTLSSTDRQVSLSRNGQTSSVVGNDYSAERVTMQTRVAVRDKNPHRFQVVPLRDVSKKIAPAEEYTLFTSKTLASQTTLLRSSSGRLGPYCQTRSLATSSSLAISSKSLGDYVDTAPLNHPIMDETTQTNFQGVSLSPPVSIRSQHHKRIPLSERDLNQPIHEITTLLPGIASMTSLTARKSRIRAATSGSSSSDTFSEYGQPTLEKTLTSAITATTEFITTRNSDVNSIPLESDVFHDPPVLPQPNAVSHGLISHYSNTVGARTSLHHVTIVPAGTLPTGSQTHKRKSRTLSENNFKLIEDSQGQTNRLLRAARTGIDASSRKRHAMYSQSLCVPFFEFSSLHFDSQGKLPIQQSNSQPSWVSDNPRDVERSGHSRANPSSPEHLTLYPESLHSSGDSKEQGTPKSNPQNSLRIPSGPAGPSTLTSDLTTNPKCSIPVLPPPRALKYPRLSRLPPKALQPKEVVYSQIVLDLFADIDQAIDEWNHCTT